MSIQTVCIVGAGVAGLVAALAFAQRGVKVDIIEQSKELIEVGAGLQISPNGSRVLDYLGVLPALEGRWNTPEAISLASGRNLRPLLDIPTGTAAIERWHAPYGALHRATLQSVLLDAVKANPLCTLHLSQRLSQFDEEEIAQIAGSRPDLIVGADGVWSHIRDSVPDAGTPYFSGFVAWRLVLSPENVPDFLPKNRVVAFLNKNSHLVSYPLRDAGGHNLVAITRGENPGESWSIKPTPEAQRRMVADGFKGWHPALVKIIAETPNPTWWPLFRLNDGKWTDGKRIALTGDAAHAMPPFAAQGAVMAIEDSYILAKLATTLPLPEALSRYEQERRPRVTKVISRGDFNSFAYHAHGPIRLARDAVFALTPTHKLVSGLDWIYGFDAAR